MGTFQTFAGFLVVTTAKATLLLLLACLFAEPFVGVGCAPSRCCR